MAAVGNDISVSNAITSTIDLMKYDNEGFLYINVFDEETFKKGEVRDVDMNLVCPGVIVPIINPSREKYREKFGYADDDINNDINNDNTLDSYYNQISHHCPLLKGKKIRIYWDDIHFMFMISTNNKIYTFTDEQFNISSVNFDLLDKRLCYYCICTHKKLVLTNIVDKTNVSLLESYNIHEDLAFEHHQTLTSVDDDTNLEKKVSNVDSFENGILFILQDGRQIEVRNTQYNYYCMLAKPERMSIYMYYVLCLNRDADGDDLSTFYNSLHDYVREYLYYYPEDTAIFEILSEKLKKYISSSDYNCDLLELDPHEFLERLLAY
jgi:hypothetical protein